jgi:hypothetical protein
MTSWSHLSVVQENDNQIPIRNHDQEFSKRAERIEVSHWHTKSVDPPKVAARDYPSEPGAKQGTIVAKIRHIDTERVQPVTARVTFYFDENGKLKDYELQRTMNDPIPQ